jgi:hypothetical protein
MKLAVLVIAASTSACIITNEAVPVGESSTSGDAAVPTPQDYAANCGSPDGPLHAYSTVDEAAQLLTGQWAYCSGDDVLNGSTQVGIELDADGIYFDLEVPGSDGALVAFSGYSADTWSLQQAAPNQVELLVTTAFSDDSLDEVWSVTFEDSPRKLIVQDQSESLPSVYAIMP